MTPYKEKIKNILKQAYPELLTQSDLTFKSLFGAVAGYIDGHIFCSCGQFGFALKLPQIEIEELFEIGGTSLKYFPNGHVKKDYVVIPEHLVSETGTIANLIKKSIEFSTKQKGTHNDNYT